MTISIGWRARTAPSGAESVVWDVQAAEATNETDLDGLSYSSVLNFAADSATTTQGAHIITSSTVDVSTFGFEAGKTYFFRVTRDTADANDDLDTRTDTNDDAMLLWLSMEFPQA